MYKFSGDNAKLKHLKPYLPEYLAYLHNFDKPKLATFSKLSGHYCPFAVDCLSKAIKTPEGMRIQDGPKTLFRCFSASQEVLYPRVYAQRKHNSELTKGKNVQELTSLIHSSLPDANVFRIHVGGDFSNQHDFDAWLNTALANPKLLFYAYTKSLPYWLKRRTDVPANFVLTASYGGRRDDLIKPNRLRSAIVVEDATKTKLPIDHDDHYACNPKHKRNFALLLHGVQGKNMNKPNYGYNKKQGGRIL